MERSWRYLIITSSLILVSNLLFLDWWVLTRQPTPKETKEAIRTVVEKTKEEETRQEVKEEGEICSPDCLEAMRREIGAAIATLSGETKVEEKEVVEKKTSQARIIYIPMGGGGSTTNRDWTDIQAAEVYLDLKDYSGVKKIIWEAFLKVKHGNGRVFARLYDVTHQVAVPGSDLSTTSETAVQERSSPLTLWSGRNLYRVQLKSLTGYQATIDSGRIKIVLE